MSDKRQDFLNIAMSHKGEGGSWAWSTSGLGSGQPWCAAFVIACAKTTGGMLGKVLCDGIFMAGYLVEASVNKGYGTYQIGGHNGGNPSPAAGDLVTYNNGSPTSGSGVFAAQHIGIVYSVNGTTVTTIEGNTNGGKVDSHQIQSNASNVAVFYRPNWASIGASTAGNVGTSSAVTVPKYSMSDSDLSFLAWVCQREQGSVIGAKAEASLICNKWELETEATRKSYNNNMATYVRTCRWWATYSTANPGTPNSDILAGVKDVIVNGNRTLPTCINEHDSLSDILSISTGSVRNRSDYVQNQTVITNRYKSTYTFYCFPTSTSDPFGYTDAALKACGGIFMPGDVTSGAYVIGGDLYDTITTREDSIIREVGYWDTSSNSLTTSSTKLRCSVINYTTQLGAFFKGAIGSGSAYSASGSDLTSTADLSGMTDTNARAIMTSLMSIGYTAAAACGILGNMYQECRLNPGSISRSTHTTAYGLCQWTDDTRNGMTNGQNMIAWVGSNWANDITGQVNYTDYTCHGNKGFPNIYSQLNSYPNTLAGAKQASELFLTKYEQPGNYDWEIPTRNGFTETFWNQIVLQI